MERRIQDLGLSLKSFNNTEQLASPGIASITVSSKQRDKMTGKSRRRHDKRAVKMEPINLLFISGKLTRQIETALVAFKYLDPKQSYQKIFEELFMIEELREHMIYERSFIGIPLQDIRKLASQFGIEDFIETQEGGVDILTTLSQPFSELWTQVGQASRKIDEYIREVEEHTNDVVVPIIFLSGTVGNYFADYRGMLEMYFQERTEKARHVRAINTIPFWGTARAVRMIYRRKRPIPLKASDELINLISEADILVYNIRRNILGNGEQLLRNSGNKYINGNYSLGFPEIHRDVPRFPIILYYSEYENKKVSEKELLQLSYTYRSEIELFINTRYQDTELKKMILELKLVNRGIEVQSVGDLLILKGELGVIGINNRKLLDKIMAFITKAWSIFV